MGVAAADAMAEHVAGSFGQSVLKMFIPGKGEINADELVDAINAATDATVRGYLVNYVAARLRTWLGQMTDLQDAIGIDPMSARSISGYAAFNIGGEMTANIQDAINLTDGHPGDATDAPDGSAARAAALQRDGLFLYVLAAQANLDRLTLLMRRDKQLGMASDEVTHLGQLKRDLPMYMTYVSGQLTRVPFTWASEKAASTSTAPRPRTMTSPTRAASSATTSSRSASERGRPSSPYSSSPSRASSRRGHACTSPSAAPSRAPWSRATATCSGRWSVRAITSTRCSARGSTRTFAARSHVH